MALIVRPFRFRKWTASIELDDEPLEPNVRIKLDLSHIAFAGAGVVQLRLTAMNDMEVLPLPTKRAEPDLYHWAQGLGARGPAPPPEGASEKARHDRRSA